MGTTASINKGKALRKHFALLYDCGSELEIIGKGIEDMSIAQNANVETKSDVLGHNETILDKYEKSTDLDPIYVEGGNKFSEFLDEVEEQNLTGDSVEKDFVWVKIYKPITSKENTYKAWKQSAVVELTSFGGDTKGVSAPCTLHWIGERTHGTVTVSTTTGENGKAVTNYVFEADSSAE